MSTGTELAEFEKAVDTVVARTYDLGFIAGLKAFAMWKHGIQYVGSTGVTLKQALEQRRSLTTYDRDYLKP